MYLFPKPPPDLLGGLAVFLELGLHRRQLIAHEFTHGFTETVAVLVKDGAAPNVWGEDIALFCRLFDDSDTHHGTFFDF